MIIKKIIIENFRQFLGHQELVFATAKTKNVTILHAENGFGKTALLNAILWGFYGHDGLTDDLPKKESILHEGLALGKDADEDTETRVSILFDDRDDKYTLVRTLNLAQQRDDSRKTKLELSINRDGQTFEESNAQAQRRISAIMPHGIRHFLFFNGEDIDHLAMEKSAGDITNAIHQMLGLELLRKTIDDLDHGNVRGKLVAELRDKTDSNTKELIDRQDELERQIQEYRTRLQDCHDNQSAVANEIKSIDLRLAANKATRELQSQRAHLEAERNAADKRLKELNEQIATLIAEDGFVLFSTELVQRGREITQRLRNEGKIPARVLNVFIEDLLKAGHCICGSELKEGTDAYNKVRELLTIAGDQYFNNAVGALDNAIGGIENAVERTRDMFRQRVSERVDLKNRHRQIAESLDEISQKLGDKDSEEIHKLEEKRQSLQLRERELYQEEGSLNKCIEDMESEREQIRRQIAAAKQNDHAAVLTQQRLQLLDDTLELLRKMLDLEMEDVREVLSKEINDQFGKIVDRRYWVDLSEDFVLSLRKELEFENGDSQEIDVAHSQGQRQITSLVFIASLVALARRRDEIPTILKGVEGGEYPMVMDSPFGQLGDEFRAGVAKWIPTLAPQVVLMVSSSQYGGAVESELGTSKRIGRRYYLCYHGPSKRDEAKSRLTIGGKKLTVYKASTKEFTEIKEVDLD